eukprot:m.92837 g.92837  ORF g.92837 m.92837 type:complete len:398 (-) comp15076_c2_seq2:197-1390(-)
MFEHGSLLRRGPLEQPGDEGASAAKGDDSVGCFVTFCDVPHKPAVSLCSGFWGTQLSRPRKLRPHPPPSSPTQSSSSSSSSEAWTTMSDGPGSPGQESIPVRLRRTRVRRAQSLPPIPELPASVPGLPSSPAARAARLKSRSLPNFRQHHAAPSSHACAPPLPSKDNKPHRRDAGQHSGGVEGHYNQSRQNHHGHQQHRPHRSQQAPRRPKTPATGALTVDHSLSPTAAHSPGAQRSSRGSQDATPLSRTYPSRRRRSNSADCECSPPPKSRSSSSSPTSTPPSSPPPQTSTPSTSTPTSPTTTNRSRVVDPRKRQSMQHRSLPQSPLAPHPPRRSSGGTRARGRHRSHRLAPAGFARSASDPVAARARQTSTTMQRVSQRDASVRLLCARVGQSYS